MEDRERMNFYFPSDVAEWLRNEIPKRKISAFLTDIIRRQMKKSQRRPIGGSPPPEL